MISAFEGPLVNVLSLISWNLSRYLAQLLLSKSLGALWESDLVQTPEFSFFFLFTSDFSAVCFTLSVVTKYVNTEEPATIFWSLLFFQRIDFHIVLEIKQFIACCYEYCSWLLPVICCLFILE